MKQINKQIIKTITLSLIASSTLLAATPNVPTISDIEKQIQIKPPKEVQQKQTPLIELNGVKKYAPVMKDDKSGKTIFVKSFEIQNAIHIEQSALQNLIKEYKNKDLTFNDLQNVASIITKEYRKKGYFVARAYIPVQNIRKNNGKIILAIIEGNYGKFILENNSLVKNNTVQAMLDDAKRDNVVSTSTLERSMLIINDTPGVVVSAADVMPGTQIGTSDFKIITQASNRINSYIIGDNTGSRYTGKNRLMAGLTINSPFNIGDKISLSGLVSNGADLKNGRVAYEMPLMANGLKGEMSYSQTNYSLTKDYEDLDAVGTSKTIDATITYPIKRTRNENLYVSLNLANKNLNDEVKSTNTQTKKNTRLATVSLAYDKTYQAYSKPTNSSVNFSVTKGNLNYDDNTQDSTNLRGGYSKVNLDLNNTIYLSNKISLESSLKMQYALQNKNLDGSEDFSIGGSSGVKLYPDGELSAENGYVINLEAKYQLPNYKNLNSSIGLFYDRGRAWMTNNNVDFEAKSLQDLGLGYYVSYKNFFAKTQMAWNVNSQDVTSEDNRNSRFLFQGGVSF